MKAGQRTGIITGVIMLASLVGTISILFHYHVVHMDRLVVMQVAADIFSMTLGTVLFVIACIKDWDEMDNLKLWYLRILAAVYVIIFADAISWILAGHQETYIFSVIADNLLFFDSPIIPFFYYCYVEEYLRVRERRAVKYIRMVVEVGIVIALLMRVVNIFHPIYFYYDQAGIYHRGNLYPLSNLYTFTCAMLAIVLAIIYRKRIKKYQLILLISFIVVPLSCVVINFLVYGLTPMFDAMMVVLTSLYILINVRKSRENSAIMAEFSMAGNIQREMLPNILPEVTDTENYDLFATMTPAFEAGGDFYDYFMLDDKTLAFLIADVSDKGIGAALFMAVSKAVIKMRAQAGGSPSEVLSDVDKRLGKDNDLGMFVTVWLGYLDIETGHVVACNAGHDFPMLYLQSDERAKAEGFFIYKTEHGLGVAMFPGMDYPEIEFDMKPGDRIFLYTDGVNEAQGKENEQFGLDRLQSVLNAHLSDSSMELCNSVKSAVDSFVGNAPQFDDMTMLALTYRGGHSEIPEG